MLAIQDILDDIELVLDGGRIHGSAIPLQRGDDLAGLVVAALPDEQTRRVGQERTEGVNQQGEEDLKCEGEAPGDAAGSEGEAQREPVGDGEAGDAVCLKSPS